MSKQPIHPGEQIALDLKDLGPSANQLAKDPDIPKTGRAKLFGVDAASALTPARRLAAWHGTSPQC
jgi:plasmid maintenance system antidote protein VapI